MTSLSVSLPQVTLLQPKISAVATASPFLKVLAPVARTRTVICSPDPVQPTLVEPKPWATPEPDFWVTVTSTNTVPVALQVTSTGTCTAAPLASSVAGDSTWTSRNSPPEKNATAGPAVANHASRPPTRTAATAVATLMRRLVLIGFLYMGGDGGGGGAVSGAGSAAPTSSVTVSTMAGRCQTKSKPLWVAKAAAAAAAPAQVAPGPPVARARHSRQAIATSRTASSVPVRSGEARLIRALATARAAPPTSPPVASSPTAPAARTPPSSVSASHRRSRTTIAARASPAHRPTSASAGWGGPAARIDGSRQTSATKAPANGPTAARATARGPRSPASTTRPTTRASAPARLIVAARPASSPVPANVSGTEPGAPTSRPSTSRLMGASTAAVALG